MTEALDIKMRCAMCAVEFMACMALGSLVWRLIEGPVPVDGVAHTTVCRACAEGARARWR